MILFIGIGAIAVLYYVYQIGMMNGYRNGYEDAKAEVKFDEKHW